MCRWARRRKAQTRADLMGDQTMPIFKVGIAGPIMAYRTAHDTENTAPACRPTGQADNDNGQEIRNMAGDVRRDPVKSLSNRIFLKISGGPLRAYSIVRHAGRTSGRQYRNPVSAYPLGDGFVIAVLYGTQSQWVRNVMVAGRFALRTKGRDYPLERPEIVPPTQALAAFPPWQRRMLRIRKIQDFVWAHHAQAEQ